MNKGGNDMIIEGVISVIFGLINLLLMPLDVVNFGFNVLTLEPVKQFIKMALYIIPFNELMPIFIFFASMMAFRIVVSLIKTIWDLLPIV